jgi:hypothetical protein
VAATEDPRVSDSPNFSSRLNQSAADLAGWSFDHRWWVVFFALALAAGSFALASRAQIDSSYEAYFDPQDPAYLAYETFRADFGSDEVSYILYEAPDAEFGPWNHRIMRQVIDLTETLEDEVPFVYEVQSLANAELMLGGENGIEIRKIQDHFPQSQEELLELRTRYLAKPMMVGGILSADAQYAAIVIKMDRTSTDPLEEIRLDPDGGDGIANLYPQVTANAIDEILNRPEYSEITFYHSGDVPLNAIYNQVISDESAFLDAVTALVIALILLIFFRSSVGVLAPVLVVQMSVLATVAFVVLVGWELDLSFGSVPTLLTAIGIAHSVHILSEFRRSFLQIGDRRAALVQTLYLVGAPCMLTSLTTAVGFAAMSLVPIKSIAHMGTYSAFGSLMAFVLSVTVLMALLSFGRRTPRYDSTRSRPRSAATARAMEKFLNATHQFVVRRRIETLIVSAGILAFSVFGISLVVVDANWLNDFSDSIPLKADTLRIDEEMGGLTNLILLFDGGEPGSVKEPAVMKEIDRIQTWANGEDLVRKSYAITDIIKDLNQTFHADDPEFYKIPDSRDLIAQYLILYESAGGDEAEEYVSSDYQRARLELRLRLDMTSETALLAAGIDEEIARNPLVASTLEITGIGALWLKLVDYIVLSQVQGFAIAFSVIAVLMCLLLGSVKTGLISMIPNLIPACLTLGVMGWLEIPLDYSKVSIAAVAMGIAVDDTIHLVLRFRHEFNLCGRYVEAFRSALLDVGRALIITSIALVAGFQVLLLSVLDSQATQGLLLSTTIVTALVADFLLMPALILTFKPFGPERPRGEHHVAGTQST